MTYVLAHTHGLRDLDFSTMAPEKLFVLNEYAKHQNVVLAPSIFLRRDCIDHIESLLAFYDCNQRDLDRIAGFSIEGPMLGDEGGVPSNSIWRPTALEWARIARLGQVGLRYVVASPDRMPLNAAVSGVVLRNVIDMFYDNGVRIAFGHFRHDSPARSADRAAEVLEYILSFHNSDKGAVLADHLFNDMPRRFKHVWRSAAEQDQRRDEIKPILAEDWTTADLDEAVGPVPAFLMRAARDGLLMPFLNFDGSHVDLEICRKAVDYIGVDHIVGITDDTAQPTLAGVDLSLDHESRLWINAEGVVAAGATGLKGQLENLAKLGYTPAEMRVLFGENAARAVSPLATQVVPYRQQA